MAFLRQLATPRVLTAAAAGVGAIALGKYYMSSCEAGAATGETVYTSEHIVIINTALCSCVVYPAKQGLWADYVRSMLYLLPQVV